MATKVKSVRAHCTISMPEILLCGMVIVARIVATRANGNCVLFKVDKQYVALSYQIRVSFYVLPSVWLAYVYPIGMGSVCGAHNEI